MINNIKSDNRFKLFSEYALINVGITTGNNDYFTVDKDVESSYELTDVLLPLIGRSAHAHGIYFTKEDWDKNVKDGKKAQLINFPKTDFEVYPKKHKDYIFEGEKSGQGKGYKCSIRDRWYRVPSIWIPDAFFLRRNNLYPKFVINKCEAVSTDTMHRLKFNEGVDEDKILLSYYNSISFAFTELCGRSYGGGVLEILPGELGNVLLPKLDDVEIENKRDLIGMIDGVVRDNGNIEDALDIVDKEILVKLLNIDVSVCKQFRAIWKKLQRRRMGRA